MLRLTIFAASKARTDLARRALHTTATIDSVELSKVQQEVHKEPEVPEPTFTIPSVRLAQITKDEKERAAVFEARAIQVDSEFAKVQARVGKPTFPSFFQNVSPLPSVPRRSMR